MNNYESPEIARLNRELKKAKKKISQLEIKCAMGELITNSPQKHTPSPLGNFPISFLRVIDTSTVPYALNDDNQNIIYLNPAFTQVFGYEISDIPTLKEWWPKAYPDPKYREWVSRVWGENLKKAQDAQAPFEAIELQIQCKDGSVRYIIASASSLTESYSHVHLVSLFDITEQRRATDALQEANAEFTATLKAIPDLLFELDEEGRYLNIWSSDDDLLAAQKMNLLGKRVQDVLSKDAATEVHTALRLAAANGVSQGQVIQLDIADEIHWFELSTALKPSKDTVQHFIMLSREITDRISAEQQLRRTQKMDALGQLTGGVAHDYNNMLGVVMGYAELLLVSLADHPELTQLTQFAQSIQHAATRGAKLTQKLLAFSRQKITDAEPLNINILIQNNQHMLGKTLTARIKLELDLTPDPWPVWLDSSDFEDALLNMSINAMHAMEGTGTLSLQTRNLTLEGKEAQAIDIAPGDYILFSVSDTGLGMDEITKERIFEPFYSTKGDNGTGLGLSQVYGFVQRSAAAIRVESSLQQGSRFMLYFPRYKREQENNPNTVTARNEPFSTHSSAKTILVVDDEPSLLKLNYEILSRCNYRVLCADSATQALALLHQEQVDLLISDIIMPEMDGYQLATIVHKRYPNVIIQLVSGYADDRNLKHITKKLQQNILEKPILSTVLLNRVRELLQEKE